MSSKPAPVASGDPPPVVAPRKRKAAVRAPPSVELPVSLDAVGAALSCTVPGCAYLARTSDQMDDHMLQTHPLTENPLGKTFACTEGCGFRGRSKASLRNHMIKHSVDRGDAVEYPCDVPGCDFKAFYKSVLKNHQAMIHNLGSGEFPCTADNCTFIGKTKRALTAHDRGVHRGGNDKRSDIGPLQNCTAEGCTFKTVHKRSMRAHFLFSHDTTNPVIQCDIPGCSYGSKRRHTVQRHKLTHYTVKGSPFPFVAPAELPPPPPPDRYGPSILVGDEEPQQPKPAPAKRARAAPKAAPAAEDAPKAAEVVQKPAEEEGKPKSKAGAPKKKQAAPTKLVCKI